MKKFSKIIISFILVLVAGVGIFTGCAPRLSGGPSTNDAITSNGGLVVQKGEYLYFVNGYVDSSTSDNSYGNADHSAIYRAKLTNNKLSYDENGKLLDYDILVPKVSGFNRTNLYIFGDNLYYATPNTEKDNVTGEVDEKLLDFYRIGLNGENNTRIYKSEVSTDNIDFDFYEYDKNVYLTVYDTEKVLVINCANSSKTVVAEDVTSFVKPSITSNNPLNTQNIDYHFYYTRKATEEEKISGNKVCYFSLTNQTEQMINNTQNDKTYALKELNVSYISGDSSYVMYTYTQNSVELYFCSKIINNVVDFSTETKLVATKKSNPVFLYTDSGMNNQQGVITTNENGYLTLITMENSYKENAVAYSKLGKMTILSVKNGKVFYYNDDNQLFVALLGSLDDNNSLVTKQLTDSESTYDFANKVNFDICNDYAYIFKSYTGDEDSEGNAETGLYLVRVNYNAETVGEELVGKLLDAHTKTETEE